MENMEARNLANGRTLTTNLLTTSVCHATLKIFSARTFVLFNFKPDTQDRHRIQDFKELPSPTRLISLISRICLPIQPHVSSHTHEAAKVKSMYSRKPLSS